MRAWNSGCTIDILSMNLRREHFGQASDGALNAGVKLAASPNETEMVSAMPAETMERERTTIPIGRPERNRSHGFFPGQ